MDDPLVSEWSRAEREAFDRTAEGIRWADALAGLAATAGPILVGFLADRPHAGLLAGLGGLNVALAMGPGRPAERAPWGLVTLVAGTAMVALGTLAHPVVWLSVLMSLVVVGVGSFGRLSGRNGALVGFVVSAVFVISNGLVGSAADAGGRALQFLVGGALAVVLMMLSGFADPQPVEAPPDPPVVAPTADVVARVRLHSLTMASVISVSTLLYRLAGLAFGYWIPLTELAVLQPEAHSSRVRLIQRASGTLLGCGVVLVVVALSVSGMALVAMVAVASFLLFALRERSYHWLVTLLTPTALLMIATVGDDGSDLVADRLAFTAIGLLVALLVVGVTARFRGSPTR